jgi:hypothetical protein
MKAYLNRLKQKWDIRSDRQLAIVFLVFALTGSGSVKLSAPVLEFTGINEIESEWIRIPLRLIMIFPVYQALLLLVGGVFGQFRFFLNLQKRWFRLEKKSSTKDF